MHAGSFPDSGYTYMYHVNQKPKWNTHETLDTKNILNNPASIKHPSVWAPRSSSANAIHAVPPQPAKRQQTYSIHPNNNPHPKDISLQIGGNLANAYFSWICCVVIEIVYSNTIILFNPNE